MISAPNVPTRLQHRAIAAHSEAPRGYAVAGDYRTAGHVVQGLGLAVTIGLHVALAAAVLSHEPARNALTEAMPIMVRLITPPPAPDPVKPALVPPEPAKPKVVMKPVPKPAPLIQRAEPLPPTPVMVAPATAPSPYVAPPQPESPKEPPPIAAAPPAPPAPPAPEPVTPPRFDAAYLDNPAPAYPRVSRRMREQGKVVLRVLVTPAGTAERIEVRSSSGSDRLDDAAQETVRRWRFVPAKQGTQAVSAWVLVPISFTLEG
jgi:protein TonB